MVVEGSCFHHECYGRCCFGIDWQHATTSHSLSTHRTHPPATAPQFTYEKKNYHLNMNTKQTQRWCPRFSHGSLSPNRGVGLAVASLVPRLTRGILAQTLVGDVSAETYEPRDYASRGFTNIRATRNHCAQMKRGSRKAVCFA